MPARRRIRTSAGDVTVEGGGDVVIETAAVEWGPDYGGEDGDRFESTESMDGITALDAAYVDAFTDEAAVAMTALEADYGEQWVQGESIGGTVYGPPLYIDHEDNTAASTGPGSVSVNVPTGTRENDLLLAIVSKAGGTIHATADAAGWTIGHSGPTSQTPVTRAFWRIASASEPASYSFTLPGSPTDAIQATATILAIRGSHQTTPINAATSAVAASATNTVAIPAATSTVVNTLRVAFGGVDNLLNTTQGNYSYTPATGYSERNDIGINTLGVAPNVDTAAADRVLVSIGSSGTADMTISPTPTLNVNKVGVMLLIAPDPAGVPL